MIPIDVTYTYLILSWDDVDIFQSILLISVNELCHFLYHCGSGGGGVAWQFYKQTSCYIMAARASIHLFIQFLWAVLCILAVDQFSQSTSYHKLMQGLHRLEKYLKMKGSLENYLKMKGSLEKYLKTEFVLKKCLRTDLRRWKTLEFQFFSSPEHNVLKGSF